MSTEKSLQAEQNINGDAVESMAALKVRLVIIIQAKAYLCHQDKLEAQHAAKRDAQQLEIQDLRQQLEHRSEEIRGLKGLLIVFRPK